MKYGLAVVAGLLVALVWVPAFAQTSTSTPTMTPFVTWTPTAVITGTATPIPATPTPPEFGSTVVWGCKLYDGAAPICTWGDYFEFWFSTVKSGSDGRPQTVYGPIESSDNYGYYVFLPPVNTKSITAMCEVAVIAAVEKFATTGGANANAGAGVISYEARMTMYEDGNVRTVGDALVGADCVSSGYPLCAEYGNKLAEYKWELLPQYSAWPLALEDYPGGGTWPTWANRSDYAGFAGRFTAMAYGTSNNVARASVRMACEITEVERLDGSTYVPSNPVVGDYGTPTPVPTPCLPGLPCWQAWPTPVSWTPATPDPIDFGVVPGTTECFTPLPGFNSGTFSVFGYTSTVSIPELEICNEQYSFDIEFMGIQWGTLMTAFGLLGAFAILYSTMKKG